jgi:hypothetical protein
MRTVLKRSTRVASYIFWAMMKPTSFITEGEA